MMDDYERTLELVDIAQNSNGASAVQFAKTLSSLKSRINNVKSSFEELIGKLADNKAIKNIVSGFNTILQSLGKIADGGFFGIAAFTTGLVLVIRNFITNLTTNLGMAVQYFLVSFQETNTLISNDFKTKQINAIRNMESIVQSGGLRQAIENEVNKGITQGGLKGTNNLKTNMGTAVAQVGAAVASVISMANLAGAATEGTAALEGASTGQMVGTALGSIGYAFGPVAGMLASSLGGALGGVIGRFWGVALDDATYGIGSEKNIKRLTEIAEEIGEKSSQTIEENTEFTSLGEEYIELAEKQSLTNEEKERMIELNEQLASQDSELGEVYNTEISSNTIIIEQLKEKIRLKKEENAQAEISAKLATSLKEYAEQTRSSKDSLEDNWENSLGKASTQNAFVIHNENENQRKKELENIFGQGLFSTEIGYTKKEGEETLEGHRFSLNLDNVDIKLLEQYKDKIIEYYSDFTELNAEVLEDSIDELIEESKTSETKINSIYQDFVDTSISSGLDTVFANIDSSSFSAKNKDLISGLIAQQGFFTEKDFKDVLYSEDESLIEDASQRYSNDITAFGDQVVEALDKLNSDQQKVVLNTQSLIGLIGIDDKGKEFNLAKTYLKEAGKSLPPILVDALEKSIDAQKGAAGTAYANLIGNREVERTIGEIAATKGELAAMTFSQALIQTGIEDLDRVQAFYDSYLKTILNIDDKKVQQKALELINSTDLDSADGMAILAIKLEELIKDETAVNNLLEAMVPSWERMGLTGDETLDGLISKTEKLEGLLDPIAESLEGSLSWESFKELDEQIKAVTGSYIDLEKVYVTGEGLGIRNGKQLASEFAQYENKKLEKNIESQQKNAVEAYAQQQAALRLAATATGADKESYLSDAEAAETQMESYLRGIGYNSLQIAYNTAMAQQATLDAQNEQIDNYKNLIAELNRYYNLERKQLALQNEAENLALDLDLAESASETASILKLQGENLIKQQELSKRKGEILEAELETYKNYINSSYSDYLEFGEDGDIIQNNKAFISLAEKMKNATGEEAEQLQQLYENIQEVQSSYEEMYDEARDNSKEQKENLKEQIELEKELRDNIIEVQEEIQNLVIQQMKDEIDATKGKYDKIKKEDNDYLNALKKSIDKRKQLQEESDSEEEITTLQKRIALLSRDTSGIYAKEIQELQKELREKQREKTNNALDSLYEDEKERFELSHNTLDKRIETLEEELELEEETYAKSNAKVQELFKNGYDSIMNFIIEGNKEYATMTTEQQQQFTEEWDEKIRLAVGSQDALAENLDEKREEVKGIYDDIITNGINEYIAAMDLANTKKLVVEVDYSQIPLAIEEIAKLLGIPVEDLINEKVKDLKNKVSDGEPSQRDDLKGGNTSSASGGSKGDANSSALFSGKFLSGTTIEIEKDSYKTYAKGTKQEAGYYVGVYKPKNDGYVKNGNIIPLSFSETGLLNDFLSSNYLDSDTGYWLNVIDISSDGSLVRIGAYGHGSALKSNGGNSGWISREDLNKYFSWESGQHYYKDGGLVNYTGPAWVDGSYSKPEAFLSASDTENIARLRDVLQAVFSPNISSNSDSTDEKFGDTYYEFHINIDELSEEYDAEQMMKDMEKYILQKASYRKVTNVSRR